MRFDSNLAWQDATAMVKSNRDVLLALAGVFFVLPAFALALMFPQPEPPAGATFEQLLADQSPYYSEIWPYMGAALMLQMIGTLAMLALFTDRTRPTVGQAIGQGLSGLPTVLIAQLLFAVAAGLALAAPLWLAGKTGMPALVALVMLAWFVELIYVSFRLTLVSPVVIVEGIRNPVTALQRSWQLSQGNGWRIVLFYVLLIIAFVVTMLVAMALLGVLFAAVLEGRALDIVSALIGSLLQAVITVALAGVVAAIHRQLAGPSPEVVASAFD